MQKRTMLLRSKNTLDLSARLKHLDDIDWDFSSSRSQSAFSSLHWYPCRYPSQIPAAIIGALSLPGETVLDPFLGSGTTAVEAQRLNRHSIGLELNPVAALIAKAKVIPRDIKHIKRTINRIQLQVRQNTKKEAVPASVQAEKWYTLRTLAELRRLRSAISEMRGDARLIGEAAFSAILLPVCRETRHWGYVCDNTAPKEDYERDVAELFSKTLQQFVDAYEERDLYLSSSGQPSDSIAEATIIQGDASTTLGSNDVQPVQLIVTSPPYFGVADYIKAQRLTMEWHDQDIEPLRQREIGARSKRRRGVAAEEYLADCEKVFRGCRNVLQNGRACAVIFGESSEREPMKEKFINIVESCGFKLLYERSRRIASGRRFSPRVQEEDLFIFS